jgi:molecular chaperone HscC
MLRTFGREWKISRKEEQPALYQRLRACAERARRELSISDSATLRVVWQEQEFEHHVRAEELERLAEPLIRKLRDPVLRALGDSGARADDLTEIVLVGGATRMPLVRRAVTRMFGRFPAVGLNPDEAVALGAAVQAGLKARDAALKEVVLTDVCPYSLGVETGSVLPDGSLRAGLFAPVIERNTVVPASRVRAFSTVYDDQRQVEVKIYQGESRLVSDNVQLGKLEIPVPARRSGEITVECRFTYDVDGLLEVDVRIPQTGEHHQVVIVDEESAPDREDLDRRRRELSALKVHPRELAENRAALARAERCYQQYLGDKREYVSRLITAFEASLERQEPRAIETARRAMSTLLDRLEGESYL